MTYSKENISSAPPKFRPNPRSRLMEQVREVLRYHHYAYSTEKSYCNWILRYIRFYGGQTHPNKMGAKEIERFLSHLALKEQVSASTQHQALNALVFLYKQVMDIPLQGEITHVRSKRKRNIPTVMTKEEIQRLLVMMEGKHAFMAKLIYGSGLRLMECLRLRIKDIDFGQGLIFVRAGKGGKDRTTILPQTIQPECKNWVKRAAFIYEQDKADGYGEVYMPEALARKYPQAARSLEWQWVFPAAQLSKDPKTGRVRRHHVNQSGLQKAVKRGAKKAGIIKKVGCHTLRHSFATHMLENGINIRVLQDLLGHADVKTTEIYTHVMKNNIRQLQSPLDTII